MTRTLTYAQRKCLQAIADSIDERGFPPTVREVAKAAGIPSLSTTTAQLQVLEARGYITRAEGVARGIRLLALPEGQS